MTQANMRTTCAAIVVGLVTALITTGRAQSSRIETGTASHGGFDFIWETRLEPPVPPLSDDLGMIVLETPPNIMHRVMIDRGARVYFGYNARIDVLSGGHFRVTLGALTMTPQLEKLLGENANTWRMLPSPRFPPAQVIEAGDILELPLLTNSGWGQRLTDYVTVRDSAARTFDSPSREAAVAPGAPRDFTVEDVELRLSRPTVTVRTKTASGGSGRQGEVVGDFTGSVLWLYVPYRGRYLLSLQPRADLGFRKAGDIRGSTMRFTDGATTYNLGSAARIAPGQSAFNLYVLLQKDWKPTYPHANLDTFHVGAVDRIEQITFVGNQ
jgi:hypothetical protein